MVSKIITTAKNPLIEVISESDSVIKPLDLSDIHIWAEKNIILDGQFNPCGPFNVALSPYIIEPLRAIKDHSIREVTCLAATQTAKSIILMLSAMWFLVNRPLPMMYIMQTNDQANSLFVSRLLPTMRASKIMNELLPSNPDRIKAAKSSPNSIQFDHCEFYINGCGINNLQSRPLGIILADELWLWKEGKIEHARKRMTSYSNNKMDKIVIVSQGGEIGSELHHLFLNGTQEVWNVPCINCGEFFVPSIHQVSADGKSWSDPNTGVKGINGQYDWNKLEQMLCMSCPHCKHKHKDTDIVKKLWLNSGKYVVNNQKASSDKRSFNWNAWLTRPWKNILEEFIKASHQMKQGVMEPIKDYFWQTEAEIKPVESLLVKDIKIREGNYNPRDKWEDEFVRFMTVDVQKDRYCYLIRAWTKDGRSRLITYSYVNTIDEVIEAQKDWGVPSHYTWIDTGHKTIDVYRYIIENGWYGIKGDKERDRGYPHDVYDSMGRKMEKPVWLYWKLSDNGGDPGFGDKELGMAPFYLFAVNKIKDILVRLRKGDGVEWLALPSDKFDITEYRKQLVSEIPIYEKNKQGKELRIWKKINSNEPNEILDLETYQIGMALIHRDISLKESVSMPSAKYIDNDVKV